jgi:aspartyl aminopeptidase
MDSRNYAKDLIEFIDKSPCAAWVVKNGIDMLKAAGFTEYNGVTEAGRRYYIERGGTALAAFIAGNDTSEVRICGAHTDSPALMLKPQCELRSEGGYVRLNCEVYGGAILSTWLDRPLGLAGRIMLRGDGLMPSVKLYKSDRALCIVPNCAPHLNKEINKGYIYNKQRDMLPLFSLDPRTTVLDTVASDMGIKAEDIIDYELYCYDACGGMLVGAGEDMISIGRLDDLMMSYAALRGICEANTDNTKTVVVILTDNEEVGSLTMSGASGCFPTDVLRAALGDNYSARLKNTVALSADLAHAVNPAHPELHEPLSRPYLNGGMVLKRAANKSYSTDGVSGAVFKRLCEEAGVKYQQFTNPSDRPGGTTIGPMLSAAAGISVADIGAPVMAMHSIRELGGVNDAFDSFKLFKNWFEK